MLNYGAAAQLYFVHNTDALANASLTGEQLALPEGYCCLRLSCKSLLRLIPDTQTSPPGNRWGCACHPEQAKRVEGSVRRNKRIKCEGSSTLMTFHYKFVFRLSVFVSKKVKHTSLKVCHPERAKRVEGSTHQIDCNCYHNCEDPSTSLRFATFRSG